MWFGNGSSMTSSSRREPASALVAVHRELVEVLALVGPGVGDVEAVAVGREGDAEQALLAAGGDVVGDVEGDGVRSSSKVCVVVGVVAADCAGS